MEIKSCKHVTKSKNKKIKKTSKKQNCVWYITTNVAVLQKYNIQLKSFISGHHVIVYIQKKKQTKTKRMFMTQERKIRTLQASNNRFLL